MFDQTMARAYNLSLQKQDCLFASLYPTLLSGAKCLIIPYPYVQNIYFSLKKDLSLPNNKIIFKPSHQKNQDIKKSGCYGSAGTNSYSIRFFVSFMSA